MIDIKYSGTDTTIIIVGSQSGIGKELCAKLLNSGASVIGIDIIDNGDVKLKENFNYYKADPLDIDSLQSLLLEFENHSIQSLVCLSGTIKYFKPVLEMSVEEWQEVYDISFKSCYNACKVFAPLLQRNEKGSIVNMSSGLAFGGQANYGPYTNAKASITSLTKTLATELAPSIRVNSIAPGAVDTGFIYDAEGSMRFDLKRYLSIVPLKSLAKPNEIADLILFLLSSASSHITGQCIHINGGALMI